MRPVLQGERFDTWPLFFYKLYGARLAAPSNSKGCAMTGTTIEGLKVGDSAEFSKTVSESDIYLYAGITGDLNPVHVDAEYAKKSIFKTRVAHGMLSAGFLSTVMGTRLPGPGSIYVSQQLNFLAPVRIGDTITARVEVLNIDSGKKRVTLRTTCSNQNGVVVIDGEAVVIPPRPSKA